MKSHNTKLASNQHRLAMAMKCLSVVVALTGFATVGLAPAFAQAFGYNGSPLPGQYDSTGGKATGSAVQTPTTIHHRIAQPPHSQAAQFSHSRAAPQG